MTSIHNASMEQATRTTAVNSLVDSWSDEQTALWALQYPEASKLFLSGWALSTIFHQNANDEEREHTNELLGRITIGSFADSSVLHSTILIRAREGNIEGAQAITDNRTEDQLHARQADLNVGQSDDNGNRVVDEAADATVWHDSPVAQANYIASEQDDYIIGEQGLNRIDGLGGNDTIIAFQETTAILNGGDGDDLLTGGIRGDLIVGGGGNDHLVGMAGDDYLIGEDGDDFVSGGDGNDFISGGLGDDRLLGGEGRDVFANSGGHDIVIDLGRNETLLFMPLPGELDGGLTLGDVMLWREQGNLLIGNADTSFNVVRFFTRYSQGALDGVAVEVSDGTRVSIANLDVAQLEGVTTPVSLASLVLRAEVYTGPGDYDRNSVVEQADRDFWASAFGKTDALSLQADGNGDGFVDAADMAVWRDNLGNDYRSPLLMQAPAVSAFEAVPEMIPVVSGFHDPLQAAIDDFIASGEVTSPRPEGQVVQPIASGADLALVRDPVLLPDIF